MRLATDLRRTSAVRGFLARYFADEDGGRVRPLAEYQSDAPAFADEIAEAYGYLAAGETEVQERQQIGPLRLLCEVGRGGQARVFLAEDERWERRVAVKLLDGPVSGQAMQRFRREAELASRLQHPAVCPVFDLGVDGDTPYLVMPFLAGRTLAEILVEEERVEVDRAVAWAEQLARGLHVAHEAGIVHRDVKPANVLVRPDGTPVLMDFGVARDASEQAAALTETGEAVGTPAYMAPEQVLGQTTGAETDVYALAATLYESLTGRPPFQAPTRHALFSAVLSQLVPDARRLRPEVGRDLWVVLETALAKQPAQRFSSAAELAEELQRVRERRPILSRPAGPGMRLMRWTQRSPGLAAGVLGSFAVLLTGLALTLVLLGRVEDERDEKRAALDEVEMLADRTRMEQLRDEIPRFEPPREEDLPEIEAWLERADELEGRLGEHRSILAGYRARSLPRTPEHEASDRALHELAPELERRIRNRDFVVEGHIKPLEEHGESEEETGDLEYYRQQLRDLDETIAQLEAEVSAHRTYRFVRAEDQ
ncbi:MAG: serine/threonine-protein kinase [Planctomycetota bacterium]